MKKYIYTLLIAASVVSAKPAMAQNKAYEMMVNGVKVIVQPSGNDIVEIQAVIKGGVTDNLRSRTRSNTGRPTNCIKCWAVRSAFRCFRNRR